MIPNKLKRNLKVYHGSLINKTRDYFARQLEKTEKNFVDSFVKHTRVLTRALLALYKIVFHIAQLINLTRTRKNLFNHQRLKWFLLLHGNLLQTNLKKIP